MKYYKFLTQEMTSHNNTKWEIGVPITIKKAGIRMCTDQVLHCYNHPVLAVIFNHIHANIINPRLFEISVDEIVNSDGLKFASKSQTLIKEITLPEISLEQKIEFAIKVARLVYKEDKWNLWADKWLSGEDRSKESVDAAYSAANAANAAVINTATIYAANAASYAALSASYAAVINAALSAFYAFYAASYAADAANSASYAALDKNEFNHKMIDIIESICKHE